MTTPKTPEEWADEYERRAADWIASWSSSDNTVDAELGAQAMGMVTDLIREAMAQAWRGGARYVDEEHGGTDVSRWDDDCPYEPDPKSHGGEPDPAPTPAEVNAGEASGSGPGLDGGGEG